VFILRKFSTSEHTHLLKPGDLNPSISVFMFMQH